MDLIMGDTDNGIYSEVMAITSIKTQDSAHFSAVRKMVPLRFQKELSLNEINYVVMKTLKWDEKLIKNTLSTDPKLYTLIKQKSIVSQAIACLEKVIVAGIGTAAEIGEAAEADVINRFYEFAMSDELDITENYRFGKAILDHQAKLARAFSLKGVDSNLPKRIEVIDMTEHNDVLQRLKLRAGPKDQLEVLSAS
jgi:hypothetical protein